MPDDDMTADHTVDLGDKLARIVAALDGVGTAGKRRMIAIAGAPASGKSTLAAKLVAHLGDGASLVPMDGFHLDNAVLDARGLRARKGAPESFDAAGFVRLVSLLRGTDADVAVPVFDRTRDRARAGGAIVPGTARTIVVEGNYLLLDDTPWRDLAPLFDLAVLLDVPLPVLEARLVARWRDHGHDDEAARARALSNDIPNAQLVVQGSRPADLTLTG